MKRWAGELVLWGIMQTAAMLLASEAGAEPLFGLGTWGGEVELGYERQRQETQTPGSPDIDSSRRRYHERLGIRNQGFYIADPRLFTGSLGLTFDLFQERGRADGQDTSQDGTLTGYVFDAGVLTTKPYSATLFANRNQNLIDREFGGRSELTFENRGATLRLREDSFLQDWGIPYFNSSLGAREERTRESTAVLGQRFERDETRNILNLEANKGFETADLGFRAELTDVKDALFPQRDFQTQAASLGYSLDFGSARNRRFDSRLHYFERTDGSQLEFLSADARVRIDHHADFYTDYRYLGSRNETASGETTTHTGTFHAQQRLYRNLTTDYTVQSHLQKLPAGERANHAGQLDLNYQRAFTPNRRVHARAGARYQLDDNDLASARIDVVDEPHTAPSPLGGGAGFTLDNPFVITSTIVVVDTRGGGRVTATPGIDYDIVPEGDFTRIVPLPTSPVIQPGDPLAVSYSFEVAPSIRFSTASWWLGGGMDLRWLAFSFTHEAFDQTLISGRDERFLNDRRIDTLQLELRGDWGRTQARANAAYEVLDSTRLQYTRWQFGQFLSHRLGFDWLLGLHAEESLIDFTLPARRSETRSVRATLDRFALRGWHTAAFASARRFEDSQLPAETVREAGIKARRLYGKLEVAPSLVWSSRTRGALETSDARLELRAIRRF